LLLMKRAKTTDNFDNSNNRQCPIYARNACFDVAENLGFEYFLVFDDDYIQFNYTVDDKMKHNKRLPPIISNFDTIILKILEYYQNAPFASICLAQSGDYLGCTNTFYRRKGPKRKAMNSFFCSINT